MKSKIMHPFETLTYCPKCGCRTFMTDSPKSKQCTSCGFQCFANPASAVAALITNTKGQLLLCQRALNPQKGQLDLPGGFADMEETLEQALIRELEEELHLKVRADNNMHYFCSCPNTYPYSGLIIHTLDAFFTLSIDEEQEAKLLAADDVAGIHYFYPCDVNIEHIGLTSIKQGVSLWLKAINK